MVVTGVLLCPSLGQQQASLGNATFASVQRGGIGIALNIEHLEPLTNAPADVAAARYGLEKNLGWFADPLFFGVCVYVCVCVSVCVSVC